MANIATVLRQSFEALDGCISSSLIVPGRFLHPVYDPNPEHSDENNNSDDDKTIGDSEGDYHQIDGINDQRNNSTTYSTIHRNVKNKSDIQASSRSSSRLGTEEEESPEPDCSVCYRKFGSVEDDNWFTEYGLLYSCQHSFCRCCIQRWLRQFTFENRKCPVCRSHTVFCVSSPRWLSHNSPDKDSLLCCSPRWSMVQQLVRRCLASLRVTASLHLKLSCEAIKNLVAELILDREALYHRHEITSIV